MYGNVYDCLFINWRFCRGMYNLNNIGYINYFVYLKCILLE